MNAGSAIIYFEIYFARQNDALTLYLRNSFIVVRVKLQPMSELETLGCTWVEGGRSKVAHASTRPVECCTAVVEHLTKVAVSNNYRH